MKILVVEPEKKPYAREISDDVHGMQEVVGGLIEPIRFEQKNDAIAFCNEEFLFNGSRPNRLVGGVMVHGTFFVVGNSFNEYGEEISVSLTDGQIEKYSENLNLRCMSCLKIFAVFCVKSAFVTTMGTWMKSRKFQCKIITKRRKLC